VVTFPTIVSPVRVIGGPAGPAVGPTGPMGAISLALMGATGRIGPTGMRGPSGPAGLLGLSSTLTGPVGRPGPTGSDGFPGPRGVTGAFEFIPEERVQYYERAAEFNMTVSGGAAGCKFFYTIKRQPCFLLVMIAGVATPTSTTVFRLGVAYGAGTAPNTGEFASYGDTVHVLGNGQAIPFLAMYYFDYRFGEVDFNRWFDLSSYGGGGKVKNITCIVIEF
jgi:hypothetical protein